MGERGGENGELRGGEREREREREEVAALERHASPLLFSFLAPLSCLFKATFGAFQSSRGPNRSRSISLEAKEENSLLEERVSEASRSSHRKLRHAKRQKKVTAFFSCPPSAPCAKHSRSSDAGRVDVVSCAAWASTREKARRRGPRRPLGVGATSPLEFRFQIQLVSTKERKSERRAAAAAARNSSSFKYFPRF